MKSNNNGSKTKRIISTVAIVLAFILIIGTLAALVVRVEKGSWTGWFPKQSIPSDKPDNEGSVIFTPEPSEISAMSYSISPLSERAEDGTVRVVKGSYTVTITYEPSYINEVKIDWSGDWANAGSSWASGKTFSDYVSIEPTDDYGMSANIITKVAFGEQARVTATAHDNPDIQVSFVLDYVQSVTVKTSEIGSTDFEDNFDFVVTIDFGTGTVRGNFEASTVMLYLGDEFETALKSRLNFTVRLNTSVTLSSLMTITSAISTYQNKTYLTFSGSTFRYEWFFPDWSSYTQDQKNAIYYAWFNTYLDGDFNTKNNIEISLQGTYKYNGVAVGSLGNSGVTTQGILSGDVYGADISITDINSDDSRLVFY